VTERLVRGDFLVRTVTVPEGYTMFDIADAVEEAGLGPRDQFLKEAREQTSFGRGFRSPSHNPRRLPLSRYYQFTRTQGMREIVETMVRRFRREALALNLENDTAQSVPQIVTMASIVEKETGATAERGLVASVYYNRLNKKIALDADPSVIYAHLLDVHIPGFFIIRTCGSTLLTTPTAMQACRRGR